MKFEDSDFDCQFCYDVLLRLASLLDGKLPASKTYSPHVSIGNGCAEEAYLALSDQAYGQCEKIKQLVALYIQTGKWGRPKAKEAFWLKVFLRSAYDYIYLALDERVQLGCLQLETSKFQLSRLGKEDQEVLEWLLEERWDEYVLPLWLKHHASEYIELYSYDYDEELERDKEVFERKLDDIPKEYYLWSEDGKRLQYRNGILHPPHNPIPVYVSTPEGHKKIYM